jgi:hypothetical protein
MMLNDLMQTFRLASRAIFNQYFHLPDPWKDSDSAFAAEERFSAVEAVLFQKLVAEPALLSLVDYKNMQPSICVELAEKTARAPIMVNREIKSGYWDYPVGEVARDAVMLFIQFFDWDVLSYRDNRFVRVLIKEWPSHKVAVEFDLQMLASVGAIDPGTNLLIFFFVPFEAVFRHVVIHQAIAFNDVQSFGVWRAVQIQHGKWPRLLSHGVDDEGVAFVMTYRIAVPGWSHNGGMRLVHADMADLMILVVEHCDVVRRLKHDQREILMMNGTGSGQHWLAGLG